MSRHFLALIIVGLMSVVAVSSQGVVPTASGGVKEENVKPGSKEEAVLKREAERRDAYTRLDPELVGALLSDDYLTPTEENPNLFSDKKGGLASVIRHRDAKEPYPIRSMQSSLTEVKIYGQIAVVTGIEKIEMEFINRKPPTVYTVRFLYMNVWELQGKRWMLVRASRDRMLSPSQ